MPLQRSKTFFLLLSLILLPGCVKAYKQSVGGDTVRVFTRIYLTDFNLAWQSVLDALKSSRLDVSNREGGFIQTRWQENTAEKNFIDSFGAADSYLKAQYRLKVTVAKGFYNGQPSVKISIQKEQMVQRDVLEGWKMVESDTIDENTLLYRIGRLISIRTRLAEQEQQQTDKAVEETTFE
jgi:hypothetical protein